MFQLLRHQIVIPGNDITPLLAGTYEVTLIVLNNSPTERIVLLGKVFQV
jgi:hypothetical protein